MDEPLLKIHWERFKAHVALDIATAARLLAPYTTITIAKLTLLSEGCANTNYKVTFSNHDTPVVIRIYVREQSALAREAVLHHRVAPFIPVAKHLYTDDTCTHFPYAYAVMEWIDGKLMRDIILTQNEKAIADCAFDAGQYLNQLRSIRFAQGGFFEDNLRIRPFHPDEEYFPYVMMLLEDNIVRSSLGETLRKAVLQLVTENHFILPDINEANLTHSDYDPANMLAKQMGDTWKIAAILDWEFAFAGTYLLDIGLMLRYSHKLPDCYEKNFIKGIETSGSPLPANWKKQAKLMDLLCLLQLTHYNPVEERPNTNKDVVSLIAYTVKNWNQF